MTEDPLVVVTGTSSGLGKRVATTLGRGGYRVVGIARRDVAPSALGLSAERYQHLCFDLADVDSIPALVDKLVRDFGAPYGLVNNAAVGLDGLLLTMHNSDISRMLHLNITSPIVLTKYLARPMVQARKGRIVNVSSVVARTGYRGLSVYAASKAALEGFSRSLARDLGPREVTVNCVAPGFVETEMTSGLSAGNLERIRRRSALGRSPSQDEVAASVMYLMSPSAAGVTGTVITVDAGSTA